MKTVTASNSKLIHNSVLLGSIATVVLLFINWFFFQNKIIDLLSLIGSIASIIGLAIVFIQLSAIRSDAAIARQAALDTQQSIKNSFLVSDVSRTIKVIHEIQSYNRGGKYELSLIRMQELKHSLLQIGNNFTAKEYVKSKEYHKSSTSLSIEINALEKQIHYPQAQLDITKINGTLESILNLLIDLDTKIKYTETKNA